jgi:hypothetical protein
MMANVSSPHGSVVDLQKGGDTDIYCEATDSLALHNTQRTHAADTINCNRMTKRTAGMKI